MAVGFIKSSFEQFIRQMVLTKERHISDLHKNLMTILPKADMDQNEIERIINNYEAVCGNYVRQSRKQILRSLSYLNRRVYHNMKGEISRLNERLEMISKKMDKLERLLK